jgi:hypothetical protein
MGKYEMDDFIKQIRFIHAVRRGNVLELIRLNN